MTDAPSLVPQVPPADMERLRHLVDRDLDMVARVIRNVGAPVHDIDDLVQQAFEVLAVKLAQVEPGKEKSFLLSTAVRLAANARRANARARTRGAGDTDIYDLTDRNPSPEQLTDKKRALQVLDRVLARMEDDLRSVFVLYEVEEMTMAEISAALDLPAGTVASRLRRARESFETGLRRMGLRK